MVSSFSGDWAWRRETSEPPIPATVRMEVFKMDHE
jgi:hypothetical protein